MAPSNISPGSAATVLSFVILAGPRLETRCSRWLRVLRGRRSGHGCERHNKQ